MFIVYVEREDKSIEPYTGNKYPFRGDAEKEEDAAMNDPKVLLAWIEVT